MQRNEIMPDDITLGSVISSCANLSSLEEGVQFHAQALMSGLISFISVSNALITLYGKCGSVEECDKLFYEMKFRDEVSWTAMVSGYAQFGKAEKTIDLFEEMLRQGLKPDPVTFIGVLSACSRAGLVHSNLEIGKWAAESLLEVEPNNPAGYILLTSIYASQGKWNKLEKLNEKMIQMGYVPDPSSVLHDVEESEKIKMLGHHSEKLAIAFGLIFIPRSCPIRVVKNLRVCRDCHTVTKYISKITQREILVRDCPVPFV
ncbi:Putative pentatricopeptide repeat-containing protein At1g68930 [Linum perenne]